MLFAPTTTLKHPIYMNCAMSWVYLSSTRCMMSGYSPSASGWKDGMWELPDFRAPSIFSKSGAKLTLPIWYVAIGTMFLSLPGASACFEIYTEWCEIDLADLVRCDRNPVIVLASIIVSEVHYSDDPYSHPILGGEKAGFTQASDVGYNRDAPSATELGNRAKPLV